jgi:hypothetical protein
MLNSTLVTSSEVQAVVDRNNPALDMQYSYREGRGTRLTAWAPKGKGTFHAMQMYKEGRKKRPASRKQN